MTHVQDTLTSTQIEQNYIEDLLKTFIIEQEELEREISKLEEINYDDVEINNEEYEECVHIDFKLFLNVLLKYHD